MKKVFGPVWLSAWLSDLLPTHVFKLGKKTPWYRQSWMTDMRWIGAAMVIPLLVFAGWQGWRLLSSNPQPQPGPEGSH